MFVTQNVNRVINVVILIVILFSVLFLFFFFVLIAGAAQYFLFVPFIFGTRSQAGLDASVD